MTKKLYLLLPSLIILLFLTTGCPIVTNCKRDGIYYGKIRAPVFKGRWFHSYERGLSYMEGECYQYALDDFKDAIMDRGNDRFQIRTYGMHFSTYFPNREMGIIYYLTSTETANPVPQLYTAKEMLKSSLKSAPTKKARKWLTRVNRRILEIESQKKSVPEINIQTIAGKPYTKGSLTRSAQDVIEISGTASDPQYISKICVRNAQLTFDGTQKNVDFYTTIILSEGENEITATVHNLSGAMTTQIIRILIDQSGPEITITEQTQGYIKGYVEDDSSLKLLVINIGDKEHVITPDLNGYFEFTYYGPVSEFHIFSEDEWGNSSSIIISNELKMENKNQWYATNTFVATSDDTAASTNINDQPQIIFHGWSEKNFVFEDSLLIEGQVQRYNQLETLYVQVNDGKKINKLKSKKKIGETKSFSHKMTLLPGPNHIKVVAKDVTGKTSSKQISIFRKMCRIDQLKYRYQIKLSEPDIIDEIVEYSFPETFCPKLSRDMKSILKNNLVKHFTNIGRFQITKKNSPENNAVLLVDTTKTLLGVEIFLTLVDIETGKVLANVNDYSFFSDYDALYDLAKSCTDQICKKFPIFYASVTQKIGKDNIVCITKNNSVSPFEITLNWPIIYYLKEPPQYNPVNPKISLGSNTQIIGFGTILEEVSEPMQFIGKVVEGVKIGCEVIRQ